MGSGNKLRQKAQYRSRAGPRYTVVQLPRTLESFTAALGELEEMGVRLVCIRGLCRPLAPCDTYQLHYLAGSAHLHVPIGFAYTCTCSLA